MSYMESKMQEQYEQAEEVKHKCEQSLPRNQNCKVVISAVVEEKE